MTLYLPRSWSILKGFIAAGIAGCIFMLLLNRFDSDKSDWFRFVDSNTLEVDKCFNKTRLSNAAMAINYYLLPIQLIVLMTWGLSHNGGFTEFFTFIRFVLIMVGVRIIEVHKILLDQRISVRLKLINFPGLGIISVLVLCKGIVLYFLLQNTKVIWQFPLVLIFFFTAFSVLRSIGNTKFVEENFLELFR